MFLKAKQNNNCNLHGPPRTEYFFKEVLNYDRTQSEQDQSRP